MQALNKNLWKEDEMNTNVEVMREACLAVLCGGGGTSSICIAYVYGC